MDMEQPNPAEASSELLQDEPKPETDLAGAWMGAVLLVASATAVLAVALSVLP